MFRLVSFVFLIETCLVVCLCPVRAFPSDTEVRIGLLAALSGDVASIGEDCRRGYEMGMSFVAPDKKISGRSLVPIYGDHRGEGKAGVAEFQRLVNSEKVVAVLSHHSQPTMQISPIAKNLRIPLLGILAHEAFISDNPLAWRFWPSSKLEARALFHATQMQKVYKLASVSVQDEYTISLHNQLGTLLKASGHDFVFDQQLLRTETDFKTLVASMKRSKPEGILVNLAVPQLGPFMKQLAELGVSLPVFGNVWFMAADIQPFATDAIFENLVFSQLNAQKKIFVDLVQKFYPGHTPSVVQYACFSAMAGLLETLQMMQGPITPSTVGSALANLKQVRMPDEVLPITEREAEFHLQLMTFKNGVAVPYDS